MKLYQLRRAIRLHGRFDGNGTPRQWGELIDCTARHIYQSWKPLQRFPIQSECWPDDSYPKQRLGLEPFGAQVYTIDDPVSMPKGKRITVIPNRIDYGDGQDRFVRVVFGVQDWRFFIWELGGL